MARTTVPAIQSSRDGLNHYLAEIRKYPMLEPNEEYMLAKRYAEHKDNKAAEKLVTSHLRLVARIAMGYRNYGLPIGEVISEGNVGLMQAVMRFDPERGFRLATYAMWWIRAAIQEYILRSWSLVKIGTTANQKKLFFNLRKLKSEIKALEDGDLKPDQVKVISDRLGIPESEIISMNRRLPGDKSLNAPVSVDYETEDWQDWLVDESDNQEVLYAKKDEHEHRLAMLEEAMAGLNEREVRVFKARRLTDMPEPLDNLAEELGISRERVRQIELRTFEKIQQAVRSQVEKQNEQLAIAH